MTTFSEQIDSLNERVKNATDQLDRLRALRAVGILEASDVKTNVTPADRELTQLLHAMGLRGGIKLTVSQADAHLEGAGITGIAAIGAKLRLLSAGIISATK
jgi:hypothetical protein